MYTKSTEQQHFLKRAANHSTKGYATGRVDVLPPSATPDLERFQTIERQHKDLCEQVRLTEIELGECAKERKRLEPLYQKYSVDFQKFRHSRFVRLPDECLKLQKRTQAAKDRVNDLKRSIAEMRRLRNSEFSKNYEKCFTAVAKHLLSQATIDEIEQKVFEKIGRPRCGFVNDSISGISDRT